MFQSAQKISIKTTWCCSWIWQAKLSKTFPLGALIGAVIADFSSGQNALGIVGINLRVYPTDNNLRGLILLNTETTAAYQLVRKMLLGAAFLGHDFL